MSCRCKMTKTGFNMSNKHNEANRKRTKSIVDESIPRLQLQASNSTMDTNGSRMESNLSMSDGRTVTVDIDHQIYH